MSLRRVRSVGWSAERAKRKAPVMERQLPGADRFETSNAVSRWTY